MLVYLFNRPEGLQIFEKDNPQHRCLHLNIEKFLRKAFSTERLYFFFYLGFFTKFHNSQDSRALPLVNTFGSCFQKYESLDEAHRVCQQLKILHNFHKLLVVSYKQTNRSSCPDVLSKKGFLKNFAKFTGKHMCRSFF